MDWLDDLFGWIYLASPLLVAAWFLIERLRPQK
jgi:hypothetical protein